MDHIDQALATNALDQRFKPSIRAALSIGKRTLNKYYNKTDDTEVYRIAMGVYIIILYSYLSNLTFQSFTSPSQTEIL